MKVIVKKIYNQIVKKEFIEIGEENRYVADDGKEFQIEERCQRYEEFLKAKIVVGNLKYKHIDSEKYTKWYYCEIKEDIDNLLTLHSYPLDNSILDLTIYSYPTWIGLQIDTEGDYEFHYFTTLDQRKKEIDLFLESFKE